MRPANNGKRGRTGSLHLPRGGRASVGVRQVNPLLSDEYLPFCSSSSFSDLPSRTALNKMSDDALEDIATILDGALCSVSQGHRVWLREAIEVAERDLKRNSYNLRTVLLENDALTREVEKLKTALDSLPPDDAPIAESSGSAPSPSASLPPTDIDEDIDELEETEEEAASESGSGQWQ